MSETDVRLDRVRRQFGSVVAVDDVSLEIARGAIVSLLGPSGCGKTTTMRMIAGLEEPSEGDIFIGERRVNDLLPKDRTYAELEGLPAARNTQGAVGRERL